MVVNDIQTGACVWMALIVYIHYYIKRTCIFSVLQAKWMDQNLRETI